MANGSIINEIKALTADGSQSIPAKVRDRLMLTAISEVYQKLDGMDCKVRELIPWVMAWKWFVLVVGPFAIIGMIGFAIALITHEITVIPR